jgi:transaldolase
MVDRDFGFSLWLDFVERDFLKNEFSKFIDRGAINGATSNPAIFATAITTSSAYKEQLEGLKGSTAKAKYEAVAIEDIKLAARKLRTLYESGNDGYISIEVDPFLSNDTQGTLNEARRLFREIGEPNVMIKIPATDAGYGAMGKLIQEGISVNATLVFSPEQAQKCLDAMSRAMVEYELVGGGRVEAVISVFVSRFDRLLDSELEKHGISKATLGIMNAAKIYNLVQANPTRAIKILFASTGVKGDELAPEYYIKELYATHSINTAPLRTIEAYIVSNPSREAKLPISNQKINAYFAKIAQAGIDMDGVYERLMQEGLEAFEIAFRDMLGAIE